MRHAVIAGRNSLPPEPRAVGIARTSPRNATINPAKSGMWAGTKSVVTKSA